MKKKYKKFKILLIGGSGNLGSSIIKANKIYKLDAGDCIIFNGKNRHCGVGITKGTRYILTGFIDYIDKEFCNFYNYSLKNLTFLILILIALFLILIEKIDF